MFPVVAVGFDTDESRLLLLEHIVWQQREASQGAGLCAYHAVCSSCRMNELCIMQYMMAVLCLTKLLADGGTASTHASYAQSMCQLS